jgi:MFS family permease
VTGTVDGDLTLDVPPLRRDHKVHAWVAARGLSDLGDTVWLIALAWTAVHVAGPALAGLLVGLGTLPRAALMLFGGVFADRWDNRRTVLLTNLARVLVQVAGVVLLSAMAGHTFAVLAGVALAFGVADALHNPAASTMSRQMVRPDDLRPLMAAFQTVSRLARLAGAPIGGLLVAAFDVRVAMLVDAASFALIGLVYALWMHPRFPRALSTGTSWRRDLAGGLGYLRRTPPVRSLVVAVSGLNLFVGPALAVGLALRVTHEHWGAHTLGVLEACVGAGAAAGAIGAARWNTPRPALVGFAILVAQGAGIAALGFGGRVFVGAAAAFVGVTAGAASTYISALFVLTVDETYLGRMGSVTSLADDGLMPVAMAGFGALAGLTSVTTACLVAGAAMSLLCAWTARRFGGSGS